MRTLIAMAVLLCACAFVVRSQPQEGVRPVSYVGGQPIYEINCWNGKLINCNFSNNTLSIDEKYQGWEMEPVCTRSLGADKVPEIAACKNIQEEIWQEEKAKQ